MKKLLNSLYVTRQESYLHKERETIVVKQGSKKIAQFPAINIGNILCFGQISVSPFLMGYCAENSIGLSFYSEYGRFLARVEGKPVGNVLLRRTQHRWADDPERCNRISRLIVAAKIANSRSVLQRELRNHGDNTALSNVIDKLAVSCRQAKQANSVEQAMGIEGDAATGYFSAFNYLIRNTNFKFTNRLRRPPPDPVNAMLSFTYALVTQECVSALTGVGLDPYVGFLHKDRPGRVSLALDLLEEFRASWADRFVLTQINRKQLSPKDFVAEASGAFRLKDEARKTFLSAYQERKQVEILHPYLQESVPIGLLPHCQAMLMARHIRGDTEYYPPFLAK